MVGFHIWFHDFAAKNSSVFGQKGFQWHSGEVASHLTGGFDRAREERSEEHQAGRVGEACRLRGAGPGGLPQLGCTGSAGGPGAKFAQIFRDPRNWFNKMTGTKLTCYLVGCNGVSSIFPRTPI